MKYRMIDRSPLGCQEDASRDVGGGDRRMAERRQGRSWGSRFGEPLMWEKDSQTQCAAFLQALRLVAVSRPAIPSTSSCSAHAPVGLRLSALCQAAAWRLVRESS